jgi:hypothetical protein
MNISDSDLEKQVKRAQRDWPFIEEVEKDQGLPFGILYAVGSRETNLTNELGDEGHGHGVWQLDDRSHTIPHGFDSDVKEQAKTAAQMLKDIYDKYPDWVKTFNVYNSGQPDTSKTTGGDYGPDVNERWEWIKGHISRR